MFRPDTCYSSAHDTDASLTIDKYYDQVEEHVDFSWWSKYQNISLRFQDPAILMQMIADDDGNDDNAIWDDGNTA